jgi:hypothetical protein
VTRNPPFTLSKWYFDCVHEDGRTFIGYLGELRWKSLSIHYQSLLLHSDSEGTRTRFSLRSCPPPTVSGPALVWKSSPLHVEGTWNALEQPVRATILESDAGTIEWHCVQPRATASVRAGKAGAVCGLGYAEHLRMTIPPWRMPLKELRWGRFLSETDSLVWIDWRGPYSKRIVFHNGAEMHAESITEQQLVLNDRAVVLDFEKSFILRQGVLAKTALSRIPNVQKLFPASVLGIRECKWKSRAVLRRGVTPDSRGWAIHEVVQWP